MFIFVGITGIILFYDEERKSKLKNLFTNKLFLGTLIIIASFSIWTLNMQGDDEQTVKVKKATKQGLLGFIIALLAFLDLKAAPFFIIWLVSYYLDI